MNIAPGIAKELWRGGMRGDPLLSRELDRVRQTHLVTPCSPDGGRRILPWAPRIPPGRPQKIGLPPFLASKIRIQNFARFLKAFWLPKLSQKPPKIRQKLIKDA